MVDAVVAVALEKLTTLVEENARILSGVAEQVEEISTELKRMQLFLQDADSRNHKDQSIRHWVREIRHLAFKVEDIVETYVLEVASKNQRRGLKKIFKKFAEAKSLRNLCLEIAKAKADISTITASIQRYDIKAIGAGKSSSSGSENQWWGRQTYAHQVEEHFVGMEEDMKKLVSLVLLDDDKRHRVISIWGMGGLGKTTLARKIYKHRDVQRSFGRFAWVCITQHAQIKVILQDILMQLAPENVKEVNFMGNRELVQQIYQVQKVAKCLIVLDDMWKFEDWKSLVAAFPIGEGDSKILITTRNKKIAEIGFPYALKCLTEKESWELLQKIAFCGKFVQEFKIEQKLEPMGIQMVRNCGGLPLAISVLGGILKDKKSPTEWQMVNKYISSYLSNMENDREEGGAVARVLSWSYDDLPYYLKPCFLSLGSFQEDEMIETAEIYMLWEAEGMIMSHHQRSEESLLDVAERYLDELARRSMVQVKPHEYRIASKYRRCCLHDMMRDLCLAKGREEGFCKIMDFRGARQSFSDLSSSTKFSCRLVINMDTEMLNGASTSTGTAQENCQHIRSLRCLNLDSKLCGTEMIWPQELLNLKGSKSLRVVHLEGYDFQGKKLPLDFGRLIHLRYLNINNCKLNELPSSVAELPLLNALHLQVNNKIKVPKVWKTKKLKHLLLFTNGRYTEKGKLRLHGLNELERLYGLDSRTDEVSDLASLLNLHTLVVRVCDNGSLQNIIAYIDEHGLKLKETTLLVDGFDLVSSDEGSVLLRRVLMCNKLHHLGLSVKMSKFPKYEPGMLENLFGLSLQGCKIEEDPMGTLEMLPQLKVLMLGPDSFMGKEMTFHEWGFPQLRVLWLIRLTNLECWRVEKASIPKLFSLMVLGCGKLEMIPDGLKFVVGLGELVIHEMPDKFYHRIEKGGDDRKGDDYDKIKHVPSISLNCPLKFHLGGSTSLTYNLITFKNPVYKSL